MAPRLPSTAPSTAPSRLWPGLVPTSTDEACCARRWGAREKLVVGSGPGGARSLTGRQAWNPGRPRPCSEQYTDGLDPVMAGSGSTWPSRSRLSQVPLLVLVALVLLHSASSEPSRDFVPPGRQKREVSADFLSQMGRSVRGTLEAWIGPETMHVVSETTSQVLGAVSSCISVGFFALSGIAAQLLNALGLDGDHLTQVLQLSPGQVQTLLLWGAAALVVYWLLSLFLGLVLALLGRILWGLKLVLFLVGFVALVRSVPDPSTRALLLLGLLTLYALLSRLTGSRASGVQLEAKVRALERQVEEMRWRQRRAAKGTRGLEEE